jgi:hypothetical protein
MANPFELPDDEFRKKFSMTPAAPNTPAPAPPERNPFEEAPKPKATEPEKKSPSKLEGFTRVASNALTLGLRDRVVGMLPGRSYEEEARRTAEFKKDNPWLGVGAEVAGGIVPGAAASKAVGKGIQALGKATIPSIVGNNAVTGAGLSAGEDIVKGQLPDPLKTGVAALFGAGAGGLMGSLGRVTPMGRVKSAASDLTPEDIIKMGALRDRAASEGIPLRIPELARATAPGRAGALEQFDKRLDQLRSSTVEKGNFDEARLPKIEDAIDKVNSVLGRGPATGVKAQEAAKGALSAADGIVTKSADPFYKNAESVMVRPSSSPSIEEARSTIKKDRIVGETTKKDVRNSIGELHNVQQAIEGIIRGSEKWPQKQGIAIGDKRRLLSEMEAASPDYATAQDIVKRGRTDLVDELSAGPLGKISRTDNPNAQATALLKADSPAEVEASRRAIERLTKGTVDVPDASVPRGILATHIDDATKGDAAGFGRRAVPTDQTGDIMRMIAGDQDFGKVANTLEALKARSPSSVGPGENADGPVNALWDAIQNAGSGKSAKLLNDAKNVESLLGVGPVQSIFNAIGISGSNEAADAQFRPKKRRRDDEEKEKVRSASR